MVDLAIFFWYHTSITQKLDAPKVSDYSLMPLHT